MSNTYPRANLTLYKSKLKPSMNAYVDGLTSYLSSLTTKKSLEIQYFRHALTATLKLNLEEEYQVTSQYNYCSILNYSEDAVSNEQVCYYFITNVTQVSEDCVMYELQLDTINTIGNDSSTKGNPRNFLPNTELIREHKDRWIKPTSWTPATDRILTKKVDKISENIVPNKIMDSDTQLTNSDNVDWYLIYQGGTDENEAVDTLLCASENITIGYTPVASSKTYTRTDFDVNKYYYFLDVDNSNGNWNGNEMGEEIDKCVSTRASGGVAVIDSVDPRTLRGYVFINDGTNLKYTCLYDNIFQILSTYPDTVATIWGNENIEVSGTSVANIGTKWTTITSATCNQGNFFRVSTTDYTGTVNSPEGIQKLITQIAGIYVGTQTSQVVNTIEDLDRTQSNLVKIIKYPYCPISYTKSGSNFNFGNDWTYNLGWLKYNKTGLPTTGNSSVCSVSLNATLLTTLSTQPLLTDLKTDATLTAYETKLLHSDFKTYKMVYDSFANEIKMEQFAITSPITSAPKINVDFKPTSTINSKMAFKMNYSFASYKNTGDYDAYLLATRNNEETILNNAYINYIRNGYNYDKKANALALENQTRSATISTIGNAASVAASILGLMFGGVAVKATSAIGLGASLVNATTSTVNAWTNVEKLQEQQDNNMASKIAQLQAQAASAVGTDDIDLMSYYSGNRLHWMIYKPTDDMILALAKALDITGYKTTGRGTPNVTSRVWYNFIQCNPVIDLEGTGTLKQAWLDDLKSRYNDGVTVFHRNTINGVYTWDFAREHENWETWLVEGV